jgi:hypothetical protein
MRLILKGPGYYQIKKINLEQIIIHLSEGKSAKKEIY